jgi:hypothetical protein
LSVAVQQVGHGQGAELSAPIAGVVSIERLNARSKRKTATQTGRSTAALVPPNGAHKKYRSRYVVQNGLVTGQPCNNLNCSNADLLYVEVRPASQMQLEGADFYSSLVVVAVLEALIGAGLNRLA